MARVGFKPALENPDGFPAEYATTALRLFNKGEIAITLPNDTETGFKTNFTKEQKILLVSQSLQLTRTPMGTP